MHVQLYTHFTPQHKKHNNLCCGITLSLSLEEANIVTLVFHYYSSERWFGKMSSLWRIPIHNSFGQEGLAVLAEGQVA